MFSTLFSFENSSHRLVEIKRKDIKSEDKSKIYFWLLIAGGENASEHSITKLTFKAMSPPNADGWQTRDFEQGKLLFSAASAFISFPSLLHTEEEVKLSASEAANAYSTSMQKAVEEFLLQQ
eukprot:GDKI01005870.1.p2 GENE.GDKI01005870.1~~GDKI01005870.1.p2  ORF type:complete len:122 (-),score=21.37 GDKI01005870.1:53-418(-)